MYLSAYIPNHTNMEISKTKNASVHIYLYRFTNRPSLYGCIVSLREGGNCHHFAPSSLVPSPSKPPLPKDFFGASLLRFCRLIRLVRVVDTLVAQALRTLVVLIDTTRCKFQETEPGLSVYSPVCLLVPCCYGQYQAEGQSLPAEIHEGAHPFASASGLLISKFWHGCRSGHDRRCMRRFNSLFRTGNTKAASSSLAGNPADGDHAKLADATLVAIRGTRLRNR